MQVKVEYLVERDECVPRSLKADSEGGARALLRDLERVRDYGFVRNRRSA